MVNQDVISQLKAATVAVGLWNKENVPVKIIGTGFIIDPSGYAVTATHVILDSLEEQERLKNEEEKSTEIRIFNFQPKGDGATYQYTRIEEICNLSLNPEVNQGESKSWDVAVCRLSKPKREFPFLKIDYDAKVQVWDEIFMSGYPGGGSSLNIEKNPVETRISPLLQFGHVSGLMPHDLFSKPQGIQTDIFSTGGSSGSPIVNANDGNVIAIAQRVIGGTAFSPRGKSIVNIGMVYGASYNIMKGFDDIVKSWKEGKQYKGKVKTSYGALEEIIKS